MLFFINTYRQIACTTVNNPYLIQYDVKWRAKRSDGDQQNGGVDSNHVIIGGSNETPIA